MKVVRAMKVIIIVFEVLLTQSLIYSSSLSTGIRSIVLTRSNPGAVSVCVGEDLHFICSTNLSFIEWNITVLQSESGQSDSRTKLISDISPLTTLFINGIIFTLTRNSTLRSRPLTSVASVANVTAGSNGMIVKCTAIEQSTSERELSLVTIDVTDISQLQPPESIATHVIRYEADNVLVMLDWAPVDGVSYNVTTSPPAAVIFNASTIIRLRLHYNTQYTVSILASLCGQSLTVSHDLNFAKCSYPIVEERVFVTEYSDPALEGDSVTFGCPPGLIMVGSNTSTCMENGQWNPDPATATCKADCQSPVVNDSFVILMYNSTLEGSQLMVGCKCSPNTILTAFCHKNASWYPNPADIDCSNDNDDNNIILPATVTIMITESENSDNTTTVIIAAVLSPLAPLIILVYVLGVLSGCFCKKFKQPHRQHSSSSNSETSNRTSGEVTPPVNYEEIRLPIERSTASTEQLQQEQSLDMTENVAYGPLKSLAYARTDNL